MTIDATAHALPPITPQMDALIAAVRQQLALLRDARTRPDVDQRAMAENALHFILTAFRSAGDETLRNEIDAYLKTTEQARTHLLELAEGWRCSSCKQRVAEDATIANAKEPRLGIVCRSCGTTSPATAAGHARLAAIFPVSATWDPRANGFRWDGT